MKIFLFMVTLVWGGLASAQTALVTDSVRVSMRSGKAEHYRLIKILPPNVEVQVLETDQDYAKVKTAEGETGWVPLKLLTIRNTATEKTSSPQAVLDSTQQELVAARVELAALQREKEQMHVPQDRNSPTLFQLLLTLGGFVCGIATGALALRAYYHKRLHGLRI